MYRGPSCYEAVSLCETWVNTQSTRSKEHTVDSDRDFNVACSVVNSVERSADTDSIRLLFTEYTLVTDAGVQVCRLRRGGVHGLVGVVDSIFLLYT